MDKVTVVDHGIMLTNHAGVQSPQVVDDCETREAGQPKCYSRTGYGCNMPTQYQVFYRGRWRRIYATCYSNVATYHCIANGVRCTVR